MRNLITKNQMKKIRDIFTLALMMFVAFSCNSDFLNPDIKTDVFIETFGKTPQETEFLLTQVYIEMRSESFVGNLHTNHFPSDYSVPNTATTGARSFLSRMIQEASDNDSFGVWSANFDVIGKANLVLEKTTAGLAIENTTAADKIQWNRIAGEARFARAMGYFNLVRLYRNVPIIEKTFKTLNDINEVANGANMSVQELKVYEFIVAELNKAIAELPANYSRGRSNKFAAHGLLGKVHLQMASIEKFRDKKGDGIANYTKALENLNAVMKSGLYALKTYFPDNFIRSKQHAGANEFLFTIEFNETDKNNSNLFGGGSGFINNSNAAPTVPIGTASNASAWASDHGWSAFDLQNDLVRRFWTFEEGNFRTFDANNDKRLANTLSDCPNGSGGPNCEIFLLTREPYPFTRPYWFETIVDANSFRSNPSSADVTTLPGGQTFFNINWSGGNTANNPGLTVVKYRRNPVTQANYTNNTFDGDYPVMRYAEVLLMYAEAANELGSPNTKPADGNFSAVEAVNLLRNRARNFVYYNDLTVNKTILENSPFKATYGDVFSRQAKIGNNPAPARTANAADTLAKYYNQISAFRGIREVPESPVYRNFKEFPATRNFLPDYTDVSSQTVFREAILEERWLELAGEIGSRYYDLARYGRLISSIQDAISRINPLTKRDLIATPFGQRTLLNPDPKYVYLPIPRSEIERNSKLIQNPGY